MKFWKIGGFYEKIKIIVEAAYDEAKNYLLPLNIERLFAKSFSNVQVKIEPREEIKENKRCDYSKLIDCAAIKDLEGKIWTGKRHSHCIKTIIQASNGKIKQVSGDYEQGFVTMNNTFVDRKTAYKYVLETQQEMKGDLKMDGYDELYSEHIY